jgi:hypothetical protein
MSTQSQDDTIEAIIYKYVEKTPSGGSDRLRGLLVVANKVYRVDNGECCLTSRGLELPIGDARAGIREVTDFDRMVDEYEMEYLGTTMIIEKDLLRIQDVSDLKFDHVFGTFYKLFLLTLTIGLIV